MSPEKKPLSTGEFVKRLGVWWFVLWGVAIAAWIISGLIAHDGSLITVGLAVAVVFVVLCIPFPGTRRRN
ncbi:hypothetical protein [Aeromicrobium ginsengisoli]|uniref:DUF2207 domain-containing protein n=1 Tax=Aeromicrobium ginsengisoli TaxID=363867 RepID=A0A5M4FEL4_9ACTN|nr:hypothetical protein [Aeromicrobium ginsengisoli]KAA1397640.1 hypothetical protein ESP70_009800 [Aeromicrobium ginsengisoli]